MRFHSAYRPVTPTTTFACDARVSALAPRRAAKEYDDDDDDFDFVRVFEH